MPSDADNWKIPAKRSTMLLNKLMHALHKALDAEGGAGGQPVKNAPESAVAAARQM